MYTKKRPVTGKSPPLTQTAIELLQERKDWLISQSAIAANLPEVATTGQERKRLKGLLKAIGKEYKSVNNLLTKKSINHG